MDGKPAVLMETWNEPLIQGSVRDFTLAVVLVDGDAPVAILWTSVLGDHVADRDQFLEFLGTVRFGARKRAVTVPPRWLNVRRLEGLRPSQRP